MRTLLTVGIEAALVTGLIIAGKTVARVDLEVVNAETQTVVPPICAGSWPVEQVQPICALNGQIAQYTTITEAFSGNACSHPVCTGPVTLRTIEPFDLGSGCFKSETKNVCKSPGVCKMPTPRITSSGQIIQDVGVCASQ